MSTLRVQKVYSLRREQNLKYRGGGVTIFPVKEEKKQQGKIETQKAKEQELAALFVNLN